MRGRGVLGNLIYVDQKGVIFNSHETVGYHRTIVIDIPPHLINDNYPPKTYQPKSRRLTGDHP